ncbi:glycosyltransferase family 61 protein [Cytophagaceae bacterium DM2B3-1]|uniref:Glycosyltransferase family 61 protein n=1 Tax=Xanthocytophaga flava TaxID=3048013 RepID=A0ABT7CI08_9BACT|nr:glycosyltransferase family 61 protein [Xanthocytophaga flavus]MDJ1493378.1 glycosyltransferase family 61 protein [Xanthocytophaga flavus]
MQTKPFKKKLSRKLKKTYYALTGKVKPKSVVALSLENAQAAYGSRSDVSIHRFFLENEFELKKPKFLAEDAVFKGYKSTFPTKGANYDAVLMEIRNPNFSFQYNHLVDDENRPIYEPRVRFDELPIQHEYLLDPPKISGTVAYFSNTVPNQYGHWLQTQLPLLLSYWETFGKENIDYYYIGECPIVDFVEESFAKMGIRREQIINFSCRADRSLISMKFRDIDKINSMRTGFELDSHSVQFLQKNLFKPATPAYEGQFAKKIFVMRGNVKFRKELNLPEVKAALEPHGFTFVSMEGKTMQQEADIFGNADVIIAVHGSALHNTIFSRPGTKVVEIFPYDYFEASNFVISNYGGFDYYYMIGEPLGSDTNPNTYEDRNITDIRVDAKKLLRLCEEADILAGVTSSAV